MGGQVARGCEVGSITDGKQDLCCGLDADSRRIRSKTSEAGISSSMLSTCPAIVSRWAFSALTLAASRGIASSAASVPGTVTVCAASATKMLSTSTPGLWWLLLDYHARTRVRPAFLVLSDLCNG